MKEGQYREPQVEGRPLAGDRGFTERAVDRLPNYLAAGVGQCFRGAQVVNVDVVGLS